MQTDMFSFYKQNYLQSTTPWQNRTHIKTYAFWSQQDFTDNTHLKSRRQKTEFKQISYVVKFQI